MLDAINAAYTDEGKRPYQDIRIRHTFVLEDPFPDLDGLSRIIPAESPEPTPEQLKTVSCSALSSFWGKEV